MINENCVVKGKYSNIDVITYDTLIEEKAYKQLLELANDIVSKDTEIKVMPDYHAGAHNIIGLTMDISKSKFIVPDLIGPDIGCGVLFVPFSTLEPIDLEELDRIVKTTIPTKSIKELEHPKYQVNIDNTLYKSLVYNNTQIIEAMQDTFGTLGGGNHFIELYETEPLHYAIAIHSGSRSPGALIHKHYNNLAAYYDQKEYTLRRNKLIEDLKNQGRKNEISSTLATTSPEYFGLTKSNYKFLTGVEKNNYIHDLALISEFAKQNRVAIALRILEQLNVNYLFVESIIDKPHNYIDNTLMLRKGAQSAHEHEPVLIPINMRDGMIVGRAASIDAPNFVKYISVNDDNTIIVPVDSYKLDYWNYSLPHGAGRVYSRSKAKEELNLEDFQETMKDVYTTSVSINTLDEAPAAYKSLEQILEVVELILKTYTVYKPIYNHKGE